MEPFKVYDIYKRTYMWEVTHGDVKPRELGLLHILVRKPGLEGVRGRATIMGDGALHWLPAQSLHEHTWEQKDGVSLF